MYMYVGIGEVECVWELWGSKCIGMLDGKE